MPKRIQRKRTKGWKMPENAVYVGRPTIFGNPFEVGDGFTAEQAVNKYRCWIFGAKGTGGGGLRRISLIHHLRELEGKDLACFCPLNQPCHADFLLNIVNPKLHDGSVIDKAVEQVKLAEKRSQQ